MQELAVFTQHVGTISMWNVDFFFFDKFLDLFNQFQPSNWTTSKPEDMYEVNFWNVPLFISQTVLGHFLSLIINITIYNCCGSASQGMQRVTLVLSRLCGGRCYGPRGLFLLLTSCPSFAPSSLLLTAHSHRMGKWWWWVGRGGVFIPFMTGSRGGFGHRLSWSNPWMCGAAFLAWLRGEGLLVAETSVHLMSPQHLKYVLSAAKPCNFIVTNMLF